MALLRATEIGVLLLVILASEIGFSFEPLRSLLGVLLQRCLLPRVDFVGDSSRSLNPLALLLLRVHELALESLVLNNLTLEVPQEPLSELQIILILQLDISIHLNKRVRSVITLRSQIRNPYLDIFDNLLLFESFLK